MNPPPRSDKVPLWFLTAVLIYLAWGNQTLPSAWMHDPSNRTGGIAFLLWLGTSVGVAAWQQFSVSGLRWWTMALLLCLIGQLGSLEILKQLALAVAIMSLLENRPCRLACLAGALSWTPALGWLVREALPINPDYLRLPFLLTMLGIMLHFSNTAFRKS